MNSTLNWLVSVVKLSFCHVVELDVHDVPFAVLCFTFLPLFQLFGPRDWTIFLTKRQHGRCTVLLSQ